MRNYDGSSVAITVAGQKIESTYHHPYWVVEGRYLADRPKPDHLPSAEVNGATVPGRWVDAGELWIGDLLLLMDGRRLAVEHVALRYAATNVYNFRVGRLQNYAVGPDCVLVHNNYANSAAGFAQLSQAKEFGIQSYSQLRKLIAGAELQAHHLIEKRFAGILGVRARGMASIALTEAEHQVFTNGWRRLIPYGSGTANATVAQIKRAAGEIYSGFPDILSALGL